MIQITAVDAIIPVTVPHALMVFASVQRDKRIVMEHAWTFKRVTQIAVSVEKHVRQEQIALPVPVSVLRGKQFVTMHVLIQ